MALLDLMELHDLNDLYQDTILDHYKNPRGRKVLESFDAENQGYNPICGDKVTIQAKLHDGIIENLAVESKGCAISVASGSMLAELLPGKSLEEVRQIGETFREMMQGKSIPDDIDFGDLDVLKGVQKYHSRIKCALLAWMTLNDLIKAWLQNEIPAVPSTTENTE